jgi:hypothetical protein
MQLLEAAFRSFALGGAVWLILRFLRVQNPQVRMTAWTVVLMVSLSMPVLMHWATVTIPTAATTAITRGRIVGGIKWISLRKVLIDVRRKWDALFSCSGFSSRSREALLTRQTTILPCSTCATMVQRVTPPQMTAWR